MKNSKKVETRSLIEHMKKGEVSEQKRKKGENLVRKCSKIPWWNYLFKVYYSLKLKELEDEIMRFCQVDLQVHNTRNGLRTLEMVISISKRMGSFRVGETPMGSNHGVAGCQDLKVGLDMPIKELKTLLLKKEVQLLLLTAPGGCGKTTLVKMLCQDEEINFTSIYFISFSFVCTFKENILFVTVSKTHNVKLIVQSLFNYKSLWLGFQFQSDEDAIDSLPQLLNHIGPDPILLILDDVWLGSESLLEKFKFDIPDYKILVTSRIAFPRFEFTYHLKPLINGDVMTLFRHSTSLKEGSSYFPPDEDIKRIVRGCAGFPLVLKVIGGSLCRQKAEVWHSRLMNWIPAAAFIDMWAELYELDEDGIQAIANLQELANRNLASLVMSRKDASEVNNYYNEDFVTQHDILRELAIGKRQRLIINISKNNPPKWWTEQKQQLYNARLLSISTNEFSLSNWCNIQAPKVEAPVLNFQTQNYTLPKFMEKMDELKVLIINNYGFFHSKISNFQLLAFENCTIQVLDALPNLTEINIDYCNDLEELPVGLCDIVPLKKLSITHCHKLFILPEEIGKLVNLEVATRFNQSLHKLSILDISNCLSIMKLPKHIGEMCNLKELNMKECLRLRTQFPESIMDLEQLKLVVCDEERARLWDPIKEFLSNPEVLVAEKDINLNWLPK
ncbi:hypothetical protein ACJW31_02G167500 [Castanea mollissima]